MVFRGEFKHAGRKFRSGKFPEMFFDAGPQVGFCFRHEHALAGEPDRKGMFVGGGMEFNQFAAKEDFCSDVPMAGFDGMRGKFFQLPGKPFGVTFGKPASLGNRTATWNGEARGAILQKPEQVPPRFGTADDSQWNPALADLQEGFFRPGFFLPRKEIEKHGTSK